MNDNFLLIGFSFTPNGAERKGSGFLSSAAYRIDPGVVYEISGSLSLSLSAVGGGAVLGCEGPASFDAGDVEAEGDA
jgi:hypothetical protein